MSSSPPADRLLIVPRLAAEENDDFYPWLGSTLTRSTEVPWVVEFSPLLPVAFAPEVQPTVEGCLQRLGNDADQRARTWLLGHGVGAQAVLRVLESLEPDQTVAGVLLVASWWSLNESVDELIPWLSGPTAPHEAAARVPTGRFRVLISDNDPAVTDFESNAAQWEQACEAIVTVEPGGAQFGRTEEPLVLDLLTELRARRDAELHS